MKSGNNFHLKLITVY